MLFSSVSFLYYFLAVTLILYFAVPDKFKNAVLLVCSFAFYFYGEQIYLLLMIWETLVSYICALVIEKYRGKKTAKAFAAIGVVLCFSVLVLFKYSDFFIGTANGIFKSELSYLGLSLPIGISFYTFQSASYIIDVYRGDTAAQKNFASLALYVSFFPQLIAGPIVRYTDVSSELKSRKPSWEGVAQGAFRFAVGLFKKVIISNTLASLCEIYKASGDVSVAFSWIYAMGFTLHIYFDFSGYSDMAIGLGRVFGFTFPENFDYPYISQSVSEFWRRWHMTLGRWFRDYLYIPLGGNRVSTARWIFNIFTVWLCTGLWHGAAWNFVLWGLYFGVLIVFEKLFLSKILSKIPKVFSHIYLLLAVIFGFVIFDASSLGEAITRLSYMFGGGGVPLWSFETGYYLRSYVPVLIIGAIGATPLIKNVVCRVSRLCGGALNVIKPASVLIIMVLCTAYLVDGSFNPFLYFRF
ncbi:MAG: MBOAT family protein [Clostridiales bacterium]|nr:MBOAT family protein [Clostridiales bacterium]